MLTLSLRQYGFCAAFFCACLMVVALYMQHSMGLEPCPLCVFQRIAVIVFGVVGLLAALHNPNQQWLYLLYKGFLFVAAAFGAVIAGRHVWLQHLPADEVPSCGPGLEYMLDTFPLFDALKQVFSGSGECAEVVWQFLGLSLPEWTFIVFVIMALSSFVFIRPKDSF